MGNFEKSVKTLEQAVALAPTEAEINDHLGDAYWRVGRKSEARFQWKRAASFSKDEKTTNDILAKVESGLLPLPPRAAAEKIVKNQ
jgi:Flp pilus assembly protein TadD